MVGRSGSGWADVSLQSTVVGFVARPSTASGKWHAYLDNEGKAGSTRVGSYDTKEEAVKAVQRAALSR